MSRARNAGRFWRDACATGFFKGLIFVFRFSVFIAIPARWPPASTSVIPLPVRPGQNPNKPATHFHPHPEGRLVIKGLKVINGLFARVYHDLAVLSPPALPDRGAAILICNHTSSLDPLLIQS